MNTAVDDHLQRIADVGYTIVEDAVAPDLIDEIVETLERLERDLDIRPARNTFEGTRTYRAYNLLAHDPVFRAVPVHQAVLPIVEGVLDEGCLISSLSSIAIGPDEVPQPIHADDQIMPLPKPHPATVWPHAEGPVRGIALIPLYPSVPAAALRNPALYENLALFDALRMGRARERNLATTFFEERLAARP